MAIYRGSGGAGDATGDATNASQLALAAADEAQASATSAASSATSAAASASAAAVDAADAATSETNAAGSAADALASENAAASSASDAADSAAAAATSATNAASSASTASTQATNASNSASSASTSATNAANSATSASTSASTASTKASEAATSATNAGNSATAAATSATNAAASASTASTQATNASNSATSAASSATAASSSASSASSSASSASTSATNAASSASSASSSASSASTSATNASNSASAAATSATNAANSATSAAASAALAATFDPALYLTKANPSFTGNLTGTGDIRLNNGTADGAQLQLASSGYSDWNLDNYSGRLRAYYGSTEYFTINSSGNVGVGTSSPAYKLDVSTIAAAVSQSGTVRFGANDQYSLRLNTSTTAGGVPFAQVMAPKDSGGWLAFTSGTSDTERARIDSSGNFLIGATSAGSNGISFYGGADAYAVWRKTNASGAFIEFRNSGNTAVGTVSTNGTTTTYGTTSDHRLKENVQPMTGALAKVAALKPCTYTWKADGSDGQGFIAHELQAVVPDCVTGEKDAVDEDGNPKYQGIDTSFLVATLTAAIQEQQAIIEQLRADIAALKGTV